MMAEQRTHHYSKGFHWSHPGVCGKVCSDWYPNSQTGPCEGQVCEVVKGWKKEAPK